MKLTREESLRLKELALKQADGNLAQAAEIFQWLIEDYDKQQWAKTSEKQEQKSSFLEDDDRYRETGRTTRLADYYIQQLFNNGKVIVKDHHDKREAHLYLFGLILKRLEREHNRIISFSKSNLEINLH